MFADARTPYHRARVHSFVFVNLVRSATSEATNLALLIFALAPRAFYPLSTAVHNGIEPEIYDSIVSLGTGRRTEPGREREREGERDGQKDGWRDRWMDE